MSKPTHRAHRVTTWDACALHPMGGDSLGLDGVYVGDDVSAGRGGAFCWDEFEAYNAEPRLVRSPNMLVLGELGFSKSSLIKTLVYRQCGALGRRSWILDPKGEYGKVTRALGCEPIRLRPGGQLRLNPLAPEGGWENQLSLLAAVCEAALGRPLLPTEKSAAGAALRYTIEHIATERIHGEPLVGDVSGVLLRPPKEVAQSLNLDPATAADHTRDVALALSQLVDGDLAGMFDGPTAAGLNVRGRVVDLDLSAVYEHKALGILMTCATAWMRAQMDDARARGEDVRTHVVVDEAWRVMAYEACALWMQDSNKHSRSYGRAMRYVLHGLSDLDAAGDQGSRVERVVKGFLRDCETRVIYRQPESEVERLRELLGLTSAEIAEVKKLPQGVALWKVGHERSFLVRHVRSSVEIPMTDTDKAMAGAA